MKTIKIATVTILVLLAGATTIFAAKAKMKFIVPDNFALSSKSDTQMKQMAEELFAAVTDGTNTDVDIVKTNLVEEDYMKYITTELLAKRIDFAGTSGDWYVKLSPSIRAKMPPFIGISVNNNKNQNFCFYVRKSDNIKTAAQLRGKTLSTYTYKDARYLLYKQGFDEKLDKYFGKVIFDYKLPYEYMKDLVDKKTDAFVTWDFLVQTSLGVDPRFKDIVPVACNYYTLNGFIVMRDGLDPATVAAMRKNVLSWKTNPKLAKFKMLFVAMKGGPVELKPEDFKLSLDVDRLIVDRGWEAERKDFIKKHMK